MNIMYSIIDVNTKKEYNFFDYNIFKRYCEILFKEKDSLVMCINIFSSDVKLRKKHFIEKRTFNSYKNFDYLFQSLLAHIRNAYKEDYRRYKIEKHKIKNMDLNTCNNFLDFFINKTEKELSLLNDFENKLFKIYVLHNTQKELTGLSRIK